jgi:hypothetical protein
MEHPPACDVRILVGLDAVVYRNKTHLKLGSDENAGRLIPATGEVYFENDEVSRKYRDQVCAAEHRLGNISEISTLREEAVRLVGPESVILQKILYSGTHCGDFILVDSIPILQVEIDLIRRAMKQSEQLRQFANSLEELVRTARNEGNPIVFV